MISILLLLAISKRIELQLSDWHQEIGNLTTFQNPTKFAESIASNRSCTLLFRCSGSFWAILCRKGPLVRSLVCSTVLHLLVHSAMLHSLRSLPRSRRSLRSLIHSLVGMSYFILFILQRRAHCSLCSPPTVTKVDYD